MSNRADSDSYTYDNADSALAWMQSGSHAKGNYRDHASYILWVDLRDQRIYHHNTGNNRPGFYYGVDDPAGNTRDIQYTLNFMGYPLTWDNVWGTYTTNAVEYF